MIFYIVLQDAWLVVHSGEVHCYGFLTNAPINGHFVEFTSCSNVSLSLVQGTTYCTSPQFNREINAHKDWYFNMATILNDLSSNSSDYSVYFGSWLQIDYKSLGLSPIPNNDMSLILANSAVEFVHRIRWNKVAIITDVSDHFYLHTAEQFYKKIKTSISYLHYVQLSDSVADTDRILRAIQNRNFRIIIVSLKFPKLDLLLCRRQVLNMNWPEYSWIVLGVDNQSFQNLNCKGNIIAFQQQLSHETSPGNEKMHFKYNRLKTISATAVNITRSCHQSTYNSTFVHIYQSKENDKVYISNYSADSGLGPVTIQYIPSDQLRYSPRLFSIFAFMYSVAFVIVTNILILFICFRNEPEVKASSVTLSIIIFIASYLLLIYLVLLNFNILPRYYENRQELRDFFCFLQVWLNGLSFPSVLILSVLLVRLVRVYRLFYSYATLRKWEYHNTAMIVCVLLFSFPCLLICTVWCATDPYRSVVTTSIIDNGPLPVFAECRSSHEFYWLILLAYVLMLCFLLVVMSILTRNIKYKNFKDTKKIIGLVIIGILLGCSTLSYIVIFKIRNKDYRYTHDLLMISHLTFILECQIFLFLPKIIPTIKKKHFCCCKAE